MRITIDGSTMRLESGLVFEIREPTYDDLLRRSFELLKTASVSDCNHQVQAWLKSERKIAMPRDGDALPDSTTDAKKWNNPLFSMQVGDERVVTLPLQPDGRWKTIHAKRTS